MEKCKLCKERGSMEVSDMCLPCWGAVAQVQHEVAMKTLEAAGLVDHSHTKAHTNNVTKEY